MPCRAGAADPADLIADLAAAHEASVLERDAGHLVVAVSLRRPDGRATRYALAVDARTTEPKVREKTRQNLPAFCPNRHINQDGSFCMSWRAAKPICVTDEASAQEWWTLLLKFLRLQEAATQLRRWPNKHAWAHGAAAEAQQRAEVCAIALGPTIEHALAAGRLRVTRPAGQPNFARLEDGGRRLYSVWRQARRVATLRQRCFCGSGRPLCSCTDHADRAAELITSLEAWEAGERAFWRQLQGRACCGTLNACPLTGGTSPSVQPAPSSAAATDRAA
jgi:E2 ubiquitin ligase family protein